MDVEGPHRDAEEVDLVADDRQHLRVLPPRVRAVERLERRTDQGELVRRDGLGTPVEATHWGSGGAGSPGCATPELSRLAWESNSLAFLSGLAASAIDITPRTANSAAITPPAIRPIFSPLASRMSLKLGLAMAGSPSIEPR